MVPFSIDKYIDQEEKNKSYLRVYEDGFPTGTVIRAYIEGGNLQKTLIEKRIEKIDRGYQTRGNRYRNYS